MKHAPSFADISQEFRVSFGYVREDIRAICKGKEKINYTVALLVGCACEMLAAARGKRQHPEKVLEEVLEAGWKPLAGALFKALRHGLAHGFDTKLVSNSPPLSDSSSGGRVFSKDPIIRRLRSKKSCGGFLSATALVADERQRFRFG